MHHKPDAETNSLALITCWIRVQKTRAEVSVVWRKSLSEMPLGTFGAESIDTDMQGSTTSFGQSAFPDQDALKTCFHSSCCCTSWCNLSCYRASFGNEDREVGKPNMSTCWENSFAGRSTIEAAGRGAALQSRVTSAHLRARLDDASVIQHRYW